MHSNDNDDDDVCACVCACMGGWGQGALWREDFMKRDVRYQDIIVFKKS